MLVYGVSGIGCLAALMKYLSVLKFIGRHWKELVATLGYTTEPGMAPLAFHMTKRFSS